MHSSVGVVRCDGFYLFRLSDSGSGMGAPGALFDPWCTCPSSHSSSSMLTPPGSHCRLGVLYAGYCVADSSSEVASLGQSGARGEPLLVVES